MIESIEGSAFTIPDPEDYQEVEAPPGIYLFKCDKCSYPERVFKLLPGDTFQHSCRDSKRQIVFRGKR